MLIVVLWHFRCKTGAVLISRTGIKENKKIRAVSIREEPVLRYIIWTSQLDWGPVDRRKRYLVGLRSHGNIYSPVSSTIDDSHPIVSGLSSAMSLTASSAWSVPLLILIVPMLYVLELLITTLDTLTVGTGVIGRKTMLKC